MKISIEHYDSKRTFEIPEDSTIDDVMTELVIIVYATGYYMESIENWITEKAEEIGNNE